MTVLLATSADYLHGEPGAPALDAALAERGVDARWAVWDDASVDWAGADLVVVRSTWDYVDRPGAFLDWARSLDQPRLLNGADVFGWNVDKDYLTRLSGVPVVPTVTADDRAALADAVRRFGRTVVKPRVGAGGAGVLVVDDPDDERLGRDFVDHPELPMARGPWIAQPLVESVRTVGETSVFVLDGVAVSQVDKVPGGDEIRVHEHYGGESAPVALRPGWPSSPPPRSWRPATSPAGPSTTAAWTCSTTRRSGASASSRSPSPGSTSTCCPPTPSPSPTSSSPGWPERHGPHLRPRPGVAGQPGQRHERLP